MPPLGGRGTTREGTAGPSTGAGPLAEVHSYSEHRGAQSAAAMLAAGGRARAPVWCTTPAREKG